MTIAAYNPSTNTVKVDSMVSWDDGSVHFCDKIVRHSRFSYVYAGTLEGEVLMKKAVEALVLSNGGPVYSVLTEAESNALARSEGFLLDEGDGVKRYYYVAVSHCYLILSPCVPGGVPIAIGSGASFFRAFLAQQQDFDAAFDDAVYHCATCGGLIHEF